MRYSGYRGIWASDVSFGGVGVGLVQAAASSLFVIMER